MDGWAVIGPWRKSSRSSDSANCVEVADVPVGVLVRDSKDPGGPVLAFAEAEWTAFLAGVRGCEFETRA